MGLQDKVVVITGAGSGIGRACAYEFASQGAKVVVADIDSVAAKRTATKLADRPSLSPWMFPIQLPCKCWPSKR